MSVPRACPPSSHRGRRHRARGGKLVVVAGLAVVLGGCGVGTRGALTPEPTTGSADADAIVALLPAGDHAVFTAEYAVSVPMTGVSTTATLAQADDGSRGVTIGDTRFVFPRFSDRRDARTCAVSTGRCSNGLDAATTSDTMLGPTWASVGLRARVRTDLAAATDTPRVSDDTIAGQSVRCLEIPLTPNGTTDTVWSQYCVLDSGVVARIARADVVVELTDLRVEADSDALGVPTTTTAPSAAPTDDLDAFGDVDGLDPIDVGEPLATVVAHLG